MMEALIQARDRDVELRSQFEAEMAENKQRADAEAKRTVEVEKHRVMYADRLQIQDLQAKVAHYEAMAARTQKNIDEPKCSSGGRIRKDISARPCRARSILCPR